MSGNRRNVMIETGEEVQIKTKRIKEEKRNRDTLTIVFDLDDTLIHTHRQPNSSECNNNSIIIEIENKKYNCELRKGVKETLQRLSKKYKLILYTASQEEYAGQIVNHLEKEHKIFSKILYRNDCKQKDGIMFKMIEKVGKNMKRIICVDDNPFVWKNVENVYTCKKYNGGIDDEMCSIEKFINLCSNTDDVREMILGYTLENVI